MSLITELGRRIRNSTAFGVTTAPIKIGPDGVPVVQVKFGPLETMFLRVVEQHGFGSDLPIGTPVQAQFCAGDRSNGVITGSSSPNDRPPTSGTDDRVIFAHGFVITIKADGVHITGAPDVFITGNLHVGGFVQAAGEVTAKQGGASVGLSTHRGHTPTGGAPTPGT